MHSLAIALALKQKVAKVRYPLLITDLPQLLPLQERNIRLNDLGEDVVQSAALPWGGQVSSSVPAQYHKPDIILAADCVYFEPAFPLLLETLHALIDDESRNTVCFFCMKKRRKADMRFIAALKKEFTTEPIQFRALHPEENKVFL